MKSHLNELHAKKSCSTSFFSFSPKIATNHNKSSSSNMLLDSTFYSDTGEKELEKFTIQRFIEIAFGEGEQSSLFFEYLLHSYLFFMEERELFETAFCMFADKDETIEFRLLKSEKLVTKLKILIFFNSWTKLYIKSIMVDPKLELQIIKLLGFLSELRDRANLSKCIGDLYNQVDQQLKKVSSVRIYRCLDLSGPSNSKAFSAITLALSTDLLNLAKQLTFLDHAIFVCIDAHEIQKRLNNIYSHNYAIFCERFNRLSRLITLIVLRSEQPIRTYELLIELIIKLFDLQNFNTAYSIYLGLDHTSINRMNSFNQKKLGIKFGKSMRKIREVFKLESNQANLKEAILKCFLPCVPFMGIFIKDLNILKEKCRLNSEIKGKSKLYDLRIIKNISEIMKFIQFCQTESYKFKKNPLGRLLEELPFIEEDELYLISGNS